MRTRAQERRPGRAASARYWIELRRVRVEDRPQRWFFSTVNGGVNTPVRHALLPFHSTKEGGAGLGLVLCREIVEARGGRVRLRIMGEAPALKLTLTRS